MFSQTSTEFSRNRTFSTFEKSCRKKFAFDGEAHCTAGGIDGAAI